MLVYEPTDSEYTLATQWYSGMGKLYAIASTGNLSTGDRRPMRMVRGVWQDMTDDEWKLKLLHDLSRELYDVCVDTASETYHADDYETAEMWATKVSDMICALEDEGVEY